MTLFFWCLSPTRYVTLFFCVCHLHGTLHFFFFFHLHGTLHFFFGVDHLHSKLHYFFGVCYLHGKLHVFMLFFNWRLSSQAQGQGIISLNVLLGHTHSGTLDSIYATWYFTGHVSYSFKSLYFPSIDTCNTQDHYSLHKQSIDQATRCCVVKLLAAGCTIHNSWVTVSVFSTSQPGILNHGRVVKGWHFDFFLWGLGKNHTHNSMCLLLHTSTPSLDGWNPGLQEMAFSCWKLDLASVASTQRFGLHCRSNCTHLLCCVADSLSELCMYFIILGRHLNETAFETETRKCPPKTIVWNHVTKCLQPLLGFSELQCVYPSPVHIIFPDPCFLKCHSLYMTMIAKRSFP